MKIQDNEKSDKYDTKMSSIILILENKFTTRKEKYRPISIMNIGSKILKKILVKQTHQHIKRITQHKQLIFVLYTTFGFCILTSCNTRFGFFVCLFLLVTHFIMIDIS